MTPRFETRPGAHLLLLEQPERQQGQAGKGCRAPTPRFAGSLFASISTSFTRSNQPGAAQSRTEPATGLSYPIEFCFGSTARCPTLGGLGVRTKRLLGLKNIHVYAVGVYVDGPAAKKALGPRFKAADAKSLAERQDLFDGLVGADSVQKTLRLVISFGALRRGQFLDALEERLAPPLRAAGQPEAMLAFKKQFDGITFTKGMEIAFTQQGQQLVTQVNGQEVGRLANPTLNSALWGIYLGPDPVSPEAKASLGSALAETVLG